jgi:presenilin-like A22 family membrane protease
LQELPRKTGGTHLTTGYRASPFQILPVLTALALAGALTYSLQASKAEITPITVFPETPSGVTLNASIFVVMMAVAATMIYLLLRFRRKSMVRYLITGAMFFVTFFLLNWYSEAYATYLAPVVDVYDYWWIALTVVASGLLMLGLYKGSTTARLLAVTVVGSLTGTFLGTSIPALTAIVLLAALAVYDLISVYRGPIGKIAEMTDLEDFQGAVFTVGDLTIGMGDLVFYSMLVSTAMMNLGTLAYVGAFIGVAVGSFLGFKLLERREILPGLPLAIGIGLAAMFIASQLQAWLHL